MTDTARLRAIAKSMEPNALDQDELDDIDEIRKAAGEIERLRGEFARLGDHPLLTKQSGTSPVDWCHRALNKSTWSRAEVERLSTPNWYWDDRELESAAESITEAVRYDDVGNVVQLRPLHELPPVFVLVGVPNQVFGSSKAAEAARKGDNE